MRFRILSLVLLFGCASAFAAKQVNLQQLDQELAALRAKSDVDAAFVIGDLKLTERVGRDRLEELQKHVAGQKSREALEAIANASQFLPLPSGELPNTPAPAASEQRRIMSAVVSYVLKSLPHLPDFLATETTRRFEDSPQLRRDLATDPYRPMHYLDEKQASVAYREGREVVEPVQAQKAKTQSATGGLVVKGVFGPILSTVLLDAAHSELKWSHWENSSSGQVAVFSFSVPKDRSHYEVNYCCVAQQGATLVADVSPFRRIVAYHGELSADPVSGVIRRLMLTAELKPDDPVSEAAIAVEYGPVEIGNVTYTCPQRSVAMSLAQMVQVDSTYKFALARQMQPLKRSISATEFRDYHVFRTDSRILLQAQTSLDGNQRPLPPLGPAAVASAVPVPDPTEPTSANQPSNATTASSPEPPPAVAPRNEPPPEPEITESAKAGPPDLPSGSPDYTNTGVTFRTTTRLVDMTVLAFDKKGRPVADLKQDELEIFDNGSKQTIRSFEQAAATEPGKQEPDQAATSSASDQTVVTNRPKTAAVPFNTVVVLIDAANVAFTDLNHARQELLRFLKSAPAGERIGLYILRSYGFNVLLEPTADYGRFSAALTAWTPNAQDLARAQDEEMRNHQHIDWVLHNSDLAYVNGNDESNTDPSSYTSGGGVGAAMTHGVDPSLKSLGANPEALVLSSLIGVGRHLAQLPGHKTLVWVSSDNALADWSSHAVSREEKGDRFLDPLSIRVRETLNEAKVSIYPLDASQLESGGVSADLENQLIKSRMSLPGDGPPPPPNPTGRAAAEMHQNTRGIQPMFRELAEATGGRALRRAGDIASELSGIVADGRAAYQVSFTPDTQADDKYHVLTAKTTRPSVTLRFRTGYLYAKEPATTKDRFRQAVWDPKDVNEIGLSATRHENSNGSTLQLSIHAPDVALSQQGGRWMDKLDIFVVNRNEQTLQAKVEGSTLGLRLTPETYARVMQEGIPFEQTLGKLASGNSVRIIVVDENSRRMGSVTLISPESSH